MTVLGLLTLFLVYRLATAPISIEIFWLILLFLVTIVILGYVSYWTLSAVLMRYRIEPGQLVISWGFVRQVIPFSRIEGLIAGEQLPGARAINGLSWPGYHIAKGEVDGLGSAILYSTHRSAAELLYIVTGDHAYGISPANRDAFRQALDAEVSPSLASGQTQVVRYVGPLRLGIWHDRGAMLIAFGAIAVNLVLFGYVLYHYPELPDLLPLHFNLRGEVDFVGPRQDVLRLPAIALGLFALDFAGALVLYLRERFAAYFVLAIGFLVQAMFWVATTRIVF